MVFYQCLLQNIKDSYVSFENALQYHGLFDQMLSTVGSVTTTYGRRYTMQQTTYVFSQVKHDLYFGFTEEVIGSYRVFMAEKEKALLDMLYLKTSAHTISIVLEKLQEYTHKFDSEKLQQYAKHYGIGMVRTIGLLLDQVHIDTTQLLTCARRQPNSYSKLTQRSAQFNAKWRLYYDPYLIDQTRIESKEAKQKERSIVHYQDALFTHDEQIQQAVEALSFEPIPINSVFQK